MSSMINSIRDGIANRMSIPTNTGDDDLIAFMDVDHPSVNAHTVGFRVVCESMSGGNELVNPSFVYNMYASDPTPLVEDRSGKVGWTGVHGPYARYCVMSEWSRQATNYVRVDLDPVMSSLHPTSVSALDIESLAYLSSANFSSTGSVVEYSSGQYPSAVLPYNTFDFGLRTARYITNTDLSSLGGHYIDNPVIGGGKNEVDVIGMSGSGSDMTYMGFWPENDGSIAYLTSASYDPPKMLYSLISAGKLYAEDVSASFPSALGDYENFYLNGNFGFTVSDVVSGTAREFDWSAVTGTEFEFGGNAPYLYLLTDRSSYYLIASGSRAPTGGTSFYDTFVPSYRFAFDVVSSGSMGCDMEYFGLKPVPVNASDAPSAIQSRIESLTELSFVDLSGVTGIEDVGDEIWPRKTWPVLERDSAYAIDGDVFSFVAKIGYLHDSNSLFKSGRLYGFCKDLSSASFEASVTPTVYKEAGSENLFDLETNPSPSSGIDGSIHGTVENLFCVSGIELREVGYTEDELQYDIWWKKCDETVVPASVGKYYVKDLIGAESVRVRYENVDDPVVVYAGADGFEINCLDASGNRMTSFGLVYPVGSIDSMTFNAVSCITEYSNFVPDEIFQNENVASYFSSVASSVSGAAYFFGSDGIFDAITVPSASAVSNVVPPYYENHYQVIDSVWEDYSVEPDIDRSGLPGIGIPEDAPIDIRGSSIATWYLYVDQLTTPADSSISLEILDCHGKTADGGWVDYELIDATSSLYRDGEFFLPNGLAVETAEGDGISDLVSFNSVSVVRLKLRYRLVSTREDAVMRVGGYRVVLGYRISSSSGLHRDFVVSEAMLNPVDLNRKLSDPHMFVRNRCDSEKSTFGITYGTSATAASLTDSCYVVVADMSKYRKIVSENFYVGAWKMDDREEYSGAVSSLTVEGSPYFVGCSWVEEPGDDDSNIKVYRNYGAHHRILSPNDFFVDYGSAKFQLYGRVYWDSDSGVYKDYASDAAPSGYCIVRSESTDNDDSLSIYDIRSADSSLKRSIRVRCSAADASKSFFVRIGGGNANAVPAPSSAGQVSGFDLSISNFETASSEQFASIFLSNSDVYSNEIPETYWSFHCGSSDEENRGDLSLDWYESYGRIFVKFKDFEKIDVDVQSSATGPSKTGDKNFYRVDKSKAFTAYVTCSIPSGHSDDGNEIVLNKYQGRWGMRFFDSEGERKWDTGADHLITPMMSVGPTHSAAYTLRSAKSYDVGKVKESTKNGRMVWYGTCPYSYDIKIKNTETGLIDVRKTVTVDGSGATIPEVEWWPIWCPATPEAYLVNGVIKDGEDLVVVNGTNASYNEYSVYYVGLPNGTETVSASGWTPSHNFPASSYSGSEEFTVSFKGRLTEEWGGSMIDGENYPTAIVVAGVPYDENVTRVVGGARPKYPNSREKILFAPNEWIVADTINDKFRMILENLDYLDRNTKYYFAPPTDFIGYFGDYLVGDSRRQGYVMRNRVEIYRKYGKDTSIDDDQTLFKGCESICVDATFKASRTGGGETSNNLYCSFGDRILAMPVMGDYTGSDSVSTIYPKRVNEFITDVTRMMYSPQTGLLFCLSPNTHRVYMFEKKRYTTVDTPYYGEIGGYGGATAKNKFNHPNDMFVSSKTVDGSAADELWVCDAGNRAVKHYTIRGQWLSTIDVSVIDETPKSVCVDYLDNAYVLTEHYLIRFDSSGYALGVTKLHEETGSPMLVRSQYNAGFAYVLYSDHVAKYSTSGEFVGKFAETDVLTYTSLCVSENADVYVATNKNILHYTDALRVGSIAAMENAAAVRWNYADIALNPNENIQDIVLNNSFQRMYDDIMMYGMCIFGSITEDRTVYDMSTDERKALIGSFDKEKIFVGVNELVTVNVLNRVLGRMCDMLDMMISLI